MIGRAIGPALAFLGCAVAVWGWSQIGQLRGTVLWEFRYVVLGAGVILALSLLEWLSGRLRR